jgi:preprotein translocase SecE subunit
MARNRQRAKDRKQKLHRENIPGSLDHASGEVEEVEARIVAGADGKPVEPVPDGVAEEPVDAAGPDAEQPKPKAKRKRKPAAPVEPAEDLEPLESPEDADELEYAHSERDADADADAVERQRLGKGAGDVAVTPDAHKPAGFRVFNFFRACWAELQRVDWPDRRQVGQATAVVLGFVVVAGAFLGLADVVAQRIVDLIL